MTDATLPPPATGEDGPPRVADLIGSIDWSDTPLGPREDWPDRLRAIVEVMVGSRFAMWMGWGPELTFLYNDAYAAMTLARKHPWALGQRADVVWAEIWGEIGPRIDQVMQTGNATWDENLLLFLDRAGYAEETYHTFSYSPITDETGSPVGMLCVVSEETDKVIADRRLATLRALAEGVAGSSSEATLLERVERELADNGRDLPFAAVYLYDEGDRSTARLAVLTGIERGGPLAPDRLTAQDPAVGSVARLAFGTTSVVILDDLGMPVEDLPTGAWDRPATRAVVTPVRAHGTDDVIGFFVAGVNPYRALDDAYLGFISVVSGQLEAGLGNARAYEAERRRAEALAELDRSKTQFFSNVSHEFRTPLTLMIGPLEDALAQGHEAGLDRDAVALVHRNALRLLKLVNALLDFSRVEAGRTRARFEPTDLAAVTLDLASTFRSAFQRAGLELTIDCQPIDEPIHVDREMWEQIVLNLLSNALKHTFTGGVTVRLRRDGDHVDLEVIDTGIGIAPDQLDAVFQRFHRVPDARSRTFEGSGIGLSLVRTLTELHGGEVSIQSTVGEGTTFRVTLPTGVGHLPADQLATRSERATSTLVEAFTSEAARWLGDDLPVEELAALRVQRAVAPPIDRKQDDSAPTTAPRGRVLVVDDNADMRDYVARLLRDHAEVETAGDGHAALVVAGQRPPDLVLSDVMMPEMDGFALLRAIREDPALRLTPVILLSARAGEESRIDGLQAGADDYLVKPFTAAELVARVTTHLRLARQRREALELRDAFVGLVSHELRTPITTIYGAARMFEKPTTPDDVRASLMTDVVEESDRLRNLVEDLLTIARTDSGQLSLDAEPILLTRLAERVIAAEGRRWPGHQVTVEEERAVPTAWADAGYVEHVIRNLVSNAAKYSPTGSAIRIVIDGVDAEEGGEPAVAGEARLRVLDEGPGIPPGDEDRLFNLFYRSPRTALEVPGAGIGLYVCRRIVEAMGGRVWMSRRPEGGSEFGFALPTARVDDELLDADG